MEIDNYLNLLYILIKENLLKEEKEIIKFSNNSEILQKNIIKKKTKIKKVLIKIKIDENKFILVYDFPLNFFLSLSIILGDKTNLISYENEKKENIICEEIIFQKIKNKIKFKNLKKINAKLLHKKKIEFEFEKPKIIQEIIKFTKEKNKINLNQIHIVKSGNLENFCPTIKINHFKIAKLMSIPTISLIENNFIKKSTINILDENQIIKKLNPIIIFDEIVNWEFVKKTESEVFKDIKSIINIKIDTEKLIEKLNSIENVNFDKEEIIFEIENKNKIKLSSSFSKIPLPLFKSYKKQKFLEIKNKKQFLEFTGREIKLNEKFLNKIYLQTLSGEKGLYKNYFLNLKYEKIIENLNKKNKIYFNNIDELILKLIYNTNIIEIEKIEKINKKLIIELIKILKYLIKKTILKSIEYNKIPKKKKVETNLEKFYFSYANSLNLNYESFKNLKSKKEILKKTITEIHKIILVIKNNEIRYEHLYFYNQINLILIKILKEFDYEKSIEIEKLFLEYFKENKFEIKKNSINLEIEELIYSIALSKKLSLKNKLFLKIKKDFDLNLLPKKIKIIKQNPDRIIYKLNIPKIKKIFKYSFEKIIFELKNKNNLNEIIKGKNQIEVIINSKKIILKKDFFIKYNYYKNYKLIYENQFLFLAIKKPESISKIEQI